MNQKRRFKLPIDRFLLAMLVAIAIASVWPHIGAHDGPLRMDLVTKIGIGVVFFLNGIMLSTEKLKLGVRNWRLHAFIQSATYIAFPLAGAALMWATSSLVPEDLRYGVVFLCAVSSTVSSSVAMTAMARGNVPGAIFNATLSTLLGLVITPLLVRAFIHAGNVSIPIGETILDVTEQLLLPFVAGQLLRPLFGAWFSRHAGAVHFVDRAVIVLIVFNTFSDSAQAGIWREHGASILFQTAALAGVMLLVMLTLSTWAARVLGFNKEDEIAGVFCGSKKSMVNGIPMASMLFGQSHVVGLIVLPLMFYHQMQLIVCSVLAKRYAERTRLTGKDGDLTG